MFLVAIVRYPLVHLIRDADDLMLLAQMGYMFKFFPCKDLNEAWTEWPVNTQRSLLFQWDCWES